MNTETPGDFDPDSGMPIGYLSRWSYQPGDTLDVHAWCTLPWRADITRLHYGDPRPDGPGLRETPVTDLGDVYEPTTPRTYPGSMAWVPVIRLPSQVALVAWVRPTRLPDRMAVALCTQHCNGSLAWGIGISPEGHWQILVDETCVPAGTVDTGRWHLIQLYVNSTVGIRLTSLSERDRTVATAERTAIRQRDVSRLGLGGAQSSNTTVSNTLAHATFDGVIAEPCLASRTLTETELDAIRWGTRVKEAVGDALLAGWSFPPARPPVAVGQHTAGPLARRNTPAAAMPGPHGVLDALHCHSDDLTDAEWPVNAWLRVPNDTPSGVYAIRLHSKRGIDRIPFIVPPERTTFAKALLLLPTMTYLAYANEQQPAPGNYLEDAAELAQPTVLDQWLNRHPEYGSSVYDRHVDGSGVSYTSLRRPIPNIRPDYLHWISGEPRHLGADLYIVDWLDRTGIDYDIACDDNLNEHQFSLLEPYRVILTGSHPEYYTEAMLDALEQHLARGGRLMYLGGNGFYWVTSTSPSEPSIIEVRRGPRGYPWQCPQAETVHAFDGRTGGFWAENGRPPYDLVGLTFAAMGMEDPVPGYRISSDLLLDEHWILDGVNSPTIGTQGRLMHGAAGHEIDNVDERHGPLNGLTIVASSSGHAATLIPAPDRYPDFTDLGYHKHHADLALYQRPHGGTVFSTGSICWCGTLACQGGDEGTQRVTLNALNRFLEAPLPSSTTSTQKHRQCSERVTRER